NAVTQPAATTNASGVTTGTLSSTVAESKTVSETINGVGGTQTATVVVNPGVASKVALTTHPSSTAQSGAALAQQPVAQLQDANNNPVSQGGVTIAASVASGPAGATLTGATASTGTTGAAPFSGLTINGSTGTYTLSFAANTLTPGTSSAIALSAGAAAQLGITTQPSSSAQSGAAFAQQPVVQLRDASGNAVSQAGVTVAAAIASGGRRLGRGGAAAAVAAGGGGRGGGVTAVTNTGGVATFTNLSITGTAGDRTLAFSATGLTSATSTTITITAGAASQVSITTQPSSSAQSGVSFGQQPVLQLRDASGNAVSQSGVTVTAAIVTGAGTLGGTLTATTNASGVASFTNLSITGATGDRTLGFSATGRSRG